MSVYTYNITGDNGKTGDIFVTTSDTATNDSGQGMGFDVLKITGTFDGKTISGEYGQGGKTQYSSNLSSWDNVIFNGDSQGNGGSYFGIDGGGIAFTANSQQYAIYSEGTSGPLSVETMGNPYYDPITLNSTDAPCYCAGAGVLTDRGEVAVEHLRIGDNVVTASGAVRPIKWIGTRAYAARFARNNSDVHPICFKAGSLNDNIPTRDLWVSPHHAMFLDGVLIPAQRLVNGATIVQPPPCDDVLYFHVELDSHDVLMVDGAASESFLDDGSRAMFQNAATYAPLYPEAPRAADYCAPRVEDGHAVERVRRRLGQRAGLAIAPELDLGALEGEIERWDATGVSGWASNAAHPGAPVCLDVCVDGALIGYAYADAPRAEGGCGFAFRFATPLDVSSGGRLELRRSADGARLAA